MPLTRAAKSKQPSGGLVQQQSLGLKRKADGRTVLGEKNMNTGVRKALISRNKNVKVQSKTQQKQLTPKIEVPKLENFSGHDDFTTVPVSINLENISNVIFI